jgi:hypothetical protein
MSDAQLKDEVRNRVLKDPGYAIAWALLEVAEQQNRVATQLKYLGTGNAATEMGAVELLAKELKDGLANLAMALEDRG